MANYEEARVKLTNTQQNKLKSAAKNKTGTALRIKNKNFQDEELSHELFLTTRQPNKHSSWWKRLEDVFCLHLQKTFLKTTWLRRIYSSWSCVFKTSSRRLEDVFKTFSRCTAKFSSRHLQDAFKIYYRVKLFLLAHLQDVFKTYSTRFWDVLRRRLSKEKFISKDELFGWRTFKIVFLKHFMKWLLLLQTKILLLKSGLRKDVTVSVNRESMNKSSSKNVFLRI